jgi:hypothetical protein
VSDLTRGDRVAWLYGGDKLSVVHRALNASLTFCSRVIASEEQRITPHPKMSNCGTCERMYARAESYEDSLSRRAS